MGLVIWVTLHSKVDDLTLYHISCLESGTDCNLILNLPIIVSFLNRVSSTKQKENWPYWSDDKVSCIKSGLSQAIKDVHTYDAEKICDR